MEIRELKKVLKKEIRLAKDVYIIGHNDIDLDSFGALLGLYLISNKFNKNTSIIINDKVIEPGVKKAMEKLRNINNISNLENKNLNGSLLIIADTNKTNLISFYQRLPEFQSVIIIDHHDVNKDTINSKFLFVDSKYSSTCEIITELIRLFKVDITPFEATVLFSGIVLDTNNFILKANKRTFYNAYYLLSKGASTIEVQYLLKQDLKKFVSRQKMLTNVKILDQKIAIACGEPNETYRREDLAKIAETLLLFNKIESSFVIGNLTKNEIGISGRTLGKLNVGKVMGKLNGGGNQTEGATKIKGEKVREVEKKLIDILNN